ncbi:MAG TPA: SAM-dependent methyltransferase [Nitrolancea sp.]|nr:SAM-dependent methyltransferase [Nitrolancea sp.]
MIGNDARETSNPQLVDELRAVIERAGPITFERFMREALYHPEHGYYLNHIVRPGREGDFITAPEAHPIFGYALARQIAQMAEILGYPEPFTLREYGAGSGALALAMLEGLQVEHPQLLRSLRYEPVELNQTRLAELRSTLLDEGFGEQLSAPDDRPLTGCVLANEFLDAFPVHRIELREGALVELYVVWRDGWFAEEAGPPSTAEIERYLEAEEITLVEGQRAEINLGLVEWIADVARRLHRGYLLLIDYGYRAETLFGPSYCEGTLRAYYQHTVSDDPFRAIGNQDLTAHVDFSALERAARQHGLHVLGLTTQADFLSGAGIGELLVAAQQWDGMTLDEYVEVRSAVIRMIEPGAMGRFRVLILGRDVPQTPELIGLSTLP